MNKVEKRWPYTIDPKPQLLIDMPGVGWQVIGTSWPVIIEMPEVCIDLLVEDHKAAGMLDACSEENFAMMTTIGEIETARLDAERALQVARRDALEIENELQHYLQRNSALLTECSELKEKLAIALEALAKIEGLHDGQ